jgi:hypothetical protein
MSRKLRATTKTGEPITSCEMPFTATPHEAQMYRKFHSVHCDRKDEPNHKCSGTVKVDANGVTMSCPRCGDSRKTYA